MLRRNVLIFHQAALGDFIVTWPLAMACGRVFPQSRIIFVTSAGKGKLAEHVLGVESVDVESGWAGLWGDPSSLAAGVLKLIQGAHVIFSFVAEAADLWTRNVSAIAPEAQLVHLSTKLGDNWTGHVAQALSRQLQTSQPAIASAVAQMLDWLDRRGLGRRPARRTGILIHPGSGAERKNWPRERFIETADRLRAAGYPVTVLLGEVELEKWGPAVADQFAGVAQVITPASLVDLAQQTASAGLVIANDSGPAHLSGILGVPTLCVFGPTSRPAQWKPLGPHVTVLAADSLQAITVEQVVAAALAAGPKRDATPSGDDP